MAVVTVCFKIITDKRHALRGEPWPFPPPPLCVATADKEYGLGTCDFSEIKTDHLGWGQDFLV